MRKIKASGFALATLAALSAGAGSLMVAAPASACPWGTSETRPGICVAGARQGGGMQGNAVIPPANMSPPLVQSLPGSGLTSVAGIPCTPENMGKCIALQQSQG